MKKIILALCAIIVMTSAAQAVECRASHPKGADVYWQYRLIDGRACWYAGKHKREKSELHWARPAAPKVHRDSPPTVVRQAAPAVIAAPAPAPAPVVAPPPPAPKPIVPPPPAPEPSVPPELLTFAARWVDELPPARELPSEASAAYAYAPAGLDDDMRAARALANVLTLGIAWLMLMPPVFCSILLVMRYGSKPKRALLEAK